MCFAGGSPTGDFELRLTESDVERFREALSDILTGAAHEPDYRTIREMNVRLRRATRRRQQQGEP